VSNNRISCSGDCDATQTDEFNVVPPGTKIFSDVFKHIRNETHRRNNDDMHRILHRLAWFRNPRVCVFMSGHGKLSENVQCEGDYNFSTPSFLGKKSR
jgi:hypothetical protein